MRKTYQGSCHCGKVRFEADIDLSQGTSKCNCSICLKNRLWATILKPDAFRLLSGKDDLTDYQFGSRSIHHLFCKHCGTRPFEHGYIDEIGGAFYAVNVACLDNISDEDFASIPVHYSDRRNNHWELAPAITSHL